MKKYIRPEAEYIEFYSDKEITAGDGAFGGTSATVDFGTIDWNGSGDESWD